MDEIVLKLGSCLWSSRRGIHLLHPLRVALLKSPSTASVSPSQKHSQAPLASGEIFHFLWQEDLIIAPGLWGHLRVI